MEVGQRPSYPCEIPGKGKIFHQVVWRSRDNVSRPVPGLLHGQNVSPGHIIHMNPAIGGPPGDQGKFLLQVKPEGIVAHTGPVRTIDQAGCDDHQGQAPINKTAGDVMHFCLGAVILTEVFPGKAVRFIFQFNLRIGNYSELV